jgi:hypothetical protein
VEILWVLLAVWFAVLGLFVVLRVRATRRRQQTARENVQPLPLRAAATTNLSATPALAARSRRAAR